MARGQNKENENELDKFSSSLAIYATSGAVLLLLQRSRISLVISIYLLASLSRLHCF